MAKPKSEVTEEDVYKWFTLNRRTEKMSTRTHPGGTGPSDMKIATVWGLHQFDVRVLQAALCGKQLIRDKRHHREGMADLYWIVTETIKIARDPKATIMERERAHRKIRHWQLMCARHHEVLLSERGDSAGAAPESEPDDDSGLVTEEKLDGLPGIPDIEDSTPPLPEADDGLTDETPRFDNDVRIG